MLDGSHVLKYQFPLTLNCHAFIHFFIYIQAIIDKKRLQ